MTYFEARQDMRQALKDKALNYKTKRYFISDAIGDRKDVICLKMHGHVSRQPKRCHSAMLDPKGRAFYYVSGSL